MAISTVRPWPKNRKIEWLDSILQPDPKRVRIESLDSNKQQERLIQDLNRIPTEDSRSSFVQENDGEQLDETDERGRRITIERHDSSDDLKSNSRVVGVSLIDSFTAEEIKLHLRSLGDQLSPESAPDDESACQLCGKEKLFYAVPPKYCASCGHHIKTTLRFYATVDGKYCFCASCFKNTPAEGRILASGGVYFAKLELYIGIRDIPHEEGWVECDNCKRWQHQTCALYNEILDSEGEMSYFCPHCRLVELQEVKQVVIDVSLGAWDLPRTKLSDHIEHRLLVSLAQERKQRAGVLGLSSDNVPGAEDITVRVVLDVNKEIKVKQQFSDILHGESYSSAFPYKSKVILLFQRIEGVDVCLFAMYVQEFGSECGQPNQRSVYISYIDSVRYFTPDVKSITGEALRTFVYHEVLIGYLDYCKKRGFQTCHFWACPPSKGDDYILYCHPEKQKIPKPNKLLKWYKTMLKKAYEEQVVAEYSSFYDYFLVPKGNTKVTAARLPYFDGAFWIGAIEDMVKDMEKQSDKVRLTTKRKFLSMGHDDLSLEAAKDIQVMQELEHRMMPMKENFIVVSLQSRTDVAADTKENDVVLEDDMFQSTFTFLDFCKEKRYQFNTLRLAKYSSMMILHHLHKNIVSGQGTGSPSVEAKTILDAVSHANHCRATRERPCPYPRCLKIKHLFFHTHACNVQIIGGCEECKRLWCLICLHSRHCQEDTCSVPHCKDVKNTDNLNL